jgi:hypothetical protein
MGKETLYLWIWCVILIEIKGKKMGYRFSKLAINELIPLSKKQKPDDATHHRACFYTLGYNELQRKWASTFISLP